MVVYDILLQEDVTGIVARVVITLVATWLVAHIVAVLFKRVLQEHKGHFQIHDKTKFVFVRKLVVVLIYIAGIGVSLWFIPGFKAASVSLFAGAGVIAIILGFAAQKAFSNVLAGFFIAVFEPIRIDDRVKIGEAYGFVEDINLRHTTIKTWDNKRIIIPNSKLDEAEIINYSLKDAKMLTTINFGISYDSDIDLARKIISEEVTRHPNLVDVRTETDMLSKEEPVKVRVTAHNDSSVNLRAYAWTKDQGAAYLLTYDVLESVKKRFDAEGVEIPYPYRTIVEKKRLPKPKRAGAKKSSSVKKVSRATKRSKKRKR